MSNIPEGATHTYTESGGTSFRKMSGSYWLGYADGDWIILYNPASHCYVPIQAEPEWSGEGLPPVGVEIEVKHKDATPEWARPDFYKAEIVAIGKQLVIFAAEANGCETVGKIEDYEFRPVRTPDQIAADDRLHKIRDACTAISKTLDRFKNDIPGGGAARAVIEAMIDAGYAKQVGK